jgi:hypothetical protein
MGESAGERPGACPFCETDVSLGLDRRIEAHRKPGTRLLCRGGGMTLTGARRRHTMLDKVPTQPTKQRRAAAKKAAARRAAAKKAAAKAARGQTKPTIVSGGLPGLGKRR